MNAIVMAVLSALFPYKPSPGVRVRSLEELRGEYQWWEAVAGIPFIAFGFAIGGVSFLILRWIAEWNARGLDGSRFLLLPFPGYWWLPSVFLGLILAAVPMHFLYKTMLGDRYHEYTMYGNLKYGFDTWKIFYWMSAVLTFLMAVAVAAGLTAYTRVTDQAIVIRGPLSRHERTYSFDEIESIVAVAGTKKRNGEFVPEPYHAVRFKDGAMWTTRDGLQDSNSAQIVPLIEFLAKGSGRPIEQVQLIEDFERQVRR